MRNEQWLMLAGVLLAFGCTTKGDDDDTMTPQMPAAVNMGGVAGSSPAPTGVPGAPNAPAPGGASPGTSGNPGSMMGFAGGGAPDVGTAGTPPMGTGGNVAMNPAGAGGAGNGGAGAAGSTPVPMNTGAPCIADSANEVVIIGDSYVTGFGSPPFQPALASLIPEANNYPNYAGAGCSMASGGICTGLYGNVPDQYDAAHGEHPNIKLIIMDGGGNDVLIPAAGSPDCKNLQGSSMDEGCKAIVKLSFDTATELMQRMASDGVKDVVFFFYPHIPSVDLGLGGTNANEILDYAYPIAAKLCDETKSTSGGKLTCHFIDTRKPFEDAGSTAGAGPWKNIVDDGVHPSDAGQAILAKVVSDTMKANCLGQAAATGCCVP